MSDTGSQNILVFDSGLGGLSLIAEMREKLPKATFYYAADNAYFPYGDLSEEELKARVVTCVRQIVSDMRISAAVIACNTASTLSLEALRCSFSMPFIGTVPAIKPACTQTKTGLVSVLATPGTISRAYTQKLISDFAGDVEVFLHASRDLARMAEDKMKGADLDLDALATAIEPAFRQRGGKATDVIVLGCTHYPFLREEMKKVAPWPVKFLDTSEAIARRVADVLEPSPEQKKPKHHRAFLTAEDPHMSSVLARFGFEKTTQLSV